MSSQTRSKRQAPSGDAHQQLGAKPGLVFGSICVQWLRTAVRCAQGATWPHCSTRRPFCCSSTMRRHDDLQHKEIHASDVRSANKRGACASFDVTHKWRARSRLVPHFTCIPPPAPTASRRIHDFIWVQAHHSLALRLPLS